MRYIKHNCKDIKQPHTFNSCTHLINTTCIDSTQCNNDHIFKFLENHQNNCDCILAGNY